MRTLRLAVPLVLAAFTLTCQDQPTDPLGPSELAPVFAAKCGTPPCGKGPGGGETEGSFGLSFDGNDGTYTPDSDALDLTHTFTIEGWIKPGNPLGLADPTILSKWGGGGAASYGVAFDRLKPGHLMMVTHNGTENSKIFSAAPLPADVWQHFAFVFDDDGQFDQGQAWLSIDGVLNISCGGALGGCWKGTGGDRDPVNVPYPAHADELTLHLDAGPIRGLTYRRIPQPLRRAVGRGARMERRPHSGTDRK